MPVSDISFLCQQKNVIPITGIIGSLPLEDSMKLIKKEMSKSSASLSSGVRAEDVDQTGAGPSVVAERSTSVHVNVTKTNFTGAGPSGATRPSTSRHVNVNVSNSDDEDFVSPVRKSRSRVNDTSSSIQVSKSPPNLN